MYFLYNLSSTSCSCCHFIHKSINWSLIIVWQIISSFLVMTESEWVKFCCIWILWRVTLNFESSHGRKSELTALWLLPLTSTDFRLPTINAFSLLLWKLPTSKGIGTYREPVLKVAMYTNWTKYLLLPELNQYICCPDKIT